MNDFVNRGNISFNSTRFIVLDEADRMLDMGFRSNVEEVMEHQSMVPTVCITYYILSPHVGNVWFIVSRKQS